MARRVFFSFHYDRDYWRASNLRNSWVAKGVQEAGYMDAVSWESVRRKDETAIKNWIRQQMKGTSVTVVLIGSETAGRKYINFEIEESFSRGNGILGIYIHGIKHKDKSTDWQGENPLAHVKVNDQIALSDVFKTYDWHAEDGRDNIGDWIEQAWKHAHP